MIELSPKWRNLSNNTRYFLCLGGRGSGKSFSVAFWTTMLTFEVGHKILYTRKTMTSAHLSVIPQFTEVIEAAGLQDAFHITREAITNLHTGSMILFKGLTTSSGENTAALKSLTGVTTVVLDEAEELTDESLFDKIDLSIRAKNKPNRFVLIMNPSTKEHFTYERFYLQPENNDATVIHTTYLDNADNLSDSFLLTAERMKRAAPQQYEHVYLGAWRDKAEGVIFTNWETGEFPDKATIKPIFGYDDGFTDPAAMVMTHIDKELGVIYLKECMYHQQMIETEKIDLMRKKAGKALIIAESAAPSVIENAKRNGLSIKRVNKKVVTIDDSIKELQKYKLIIDPDSINLISELNNYCWHDKKSETPVDKWNHLLDAARYAIGDVLLKPKVHSGMRITRR